MLTGQAPAGRCEGCLSLLGLVEIRVWKEREKVLAGRNPHAYLTQLVRNTYMDVMRTRNVEERSRPARPHNLKPQETARVADALGDPWLRQLLKLMMLDAWSLGPVPDEEWALDRFAAAKAQYLAEAGVEFAGKDLSASVRADVEKVIAVARTSVGERWLDDVLTAPKVLRRVEHAQSAAAWAEAGAAEVEQQLIGSSVEATHADLHQTALAAAFFTALTDGASGVESVGIAARRLAPAADLSRLAPRMLADVAAGLLADYLTLYLGREARAWTPTEVQQELNLRFGTHTVDTVTARRISHIMQK